MRDGFAPLSGGKRVRIEKGQIAMVQPGAGLAFFGSLFNPKKKCKGRDGRAIMIIRCITTMERTVGPPDGVCISWARQEM